MGLVGDPRWIITQEGERVATTIYAEDPFNRKKFGSDIAESLAKGPWTQGRRHG